MNNKLLKAVSLVISVFMIIGVFVSCGANKDEQNPSDGSFVQNNSHEPQNVLKPNGIKDNHLKPDLSKVEVPEASKEAVDCTDEEKFVSALEAFANPNGNKYDALSLLGAFRYNDDSDKLMERLETASKSWHEPIEKNVGEKCVVDIALESTAPYDMSDSVVTEWNAANGRTCKGYSRITCVITTNYSSRKLTYSFDIVNVDGSWYLAQTSILNKLQSIITTEIFK